MLMARILIAGCGDIGTAAGRLLAEDGHEVAGLKRRPPADRDLVSYIAADLSSAEDLADLDTDFDIVIYILSPDRRSEESYRQVFEHGVANLLNVFTRGRSDARFVFVSSSGVYGQKQGEWVDEDSATAPASMTGKIILQAEKSFLAHGEGSCIIRYSGIYGRGRSWLLDDVARGGGVQYEPPYYTNRIHRDDCVAVLRFIVDRMVAGDHVASVYLASDDDPAPKWDVYSTLAARLGLPSPEKKFLSPDADQNKRCSNARIKELGYRFIYSSYRDGYESLLQESG
jgi:nucleoside-diphosphate-sugar epimerase